MNEQSQEHKLLLLKKGNYDLFFNCREFDEKLLKQSIGLLNLPTGEIVANDPLCVFETEPFEYAVEAGSYPVVIYVHHIRDDRRVAFAEIQFTQNMPVRFEPALVKGQTPQALENDEYYGYGVDSGTGGFMDKMTCDEMLKLIEHMEDKMLPELDKSLEDSYVYTYSTANYTLPGTDHNLVAFSSGYGDGCYPSYWGYDESGRICCLITDFMTVDDAAAATH